MFLGCNNLKDLKTPTLINNEIDILIVIKKEDIDKVNKKIYFLDNDKNHNALNELNMSNTKVYINNEESKYIRYFEPKKKGNILLN